jgi:hypothetical protein
MAIFSNLPASLQLNPSSSDGASKAISNYYTNPIQLDSSTLMAMSAFFESRGFDPSTSKTISSIIMNQAKLDDYNPMTVLDNLHGLDKLAISTLATEILNFNRYKSSFLGYATVQQPHPEISRNIESVSWNSQYADVLVFSDGYPLTDENNKPLEGI